MKIKLESPMTQKLLSIAHCHDGNYILILNYERHVYDFKFCVSREMKLEMLL
jgi:hypothetical protein